jgi:hypothetical protein
LEKIAYAVVMVARKVRHYFEGHRIRDITNQPLNDLFANKEASTKIIKWGAKLSEYTVDFETRNAIKSHVLTDLSQIGLHQPIILAKKILHLSVDGEFPST